MLIHNYKTIVMNLINRNMGSNNNSRNNNNNKNCVRHKNQQIIH